MDAQQLYAQAIKVASERSMFRRPSERVIISGIYDIVDGYGRNMFRQVTCVEGEPFPPLVQGYFFRLNKPTNHRFY